MYVDTGEAKSNGLFEHYEASPEAIESSAEDLDRHATNIQAFSTEVDSRHQAALANVSGVISQPLSTAAQTPTKHSAQLMGYTYVSSGSIRLFGQGVQHFNHTIDNLNEQYRQAQAADFGVAEATYPEDAPLVQVVQAEEARAGLVMGARVDLLRTLVQKHREALDRLDREAEAQAAKINEGPTEQVLQDLYAAGALPTSVTLAYPHLNFKAEKLPPDLADMSDEELADYALDHSERAAELLPLLPLRTKQLIGEELADQGKGLGDDYDERQDGLKSEMDAFTEVLSAYGGDAVVATSFLNTIGARGLLDLNGRIATSIMGAQDRGPGQEATDEANSIAALQQSLGVVLAAGTSGQPTHNHWTGEGDETYVSAEWTDELLQAGRQKVTLFNGSDEVYGHQLLAPLLSHGDQSPQFLGLVGSDMLTFEQEYARDHDGTLPWEETRGATSEGLRLDWSSGHEDGDPAGFDPVTGLMRALSDDPEASREFLTGEVTQGEPPRYPRLDYLLTDREWMVDTAWKHPDAASDVSGISIFGDALQSATLEDPNGDSGRIVEAIVHELAIDEEADGHGNRDYATGEWDDGKATAFRNHDYVDDNLRGDLGMILSGYISSVHDAMSDVNDGPGGPGTNGDWDEVTPGIQTVGANFDQRELSILLADLGKDQRSYDMLVQSENVYASMAYDYHMDPSQSPEERATAAEAVSSQTGKVLGALTFGAAEKEVRTVEDADKAYNEDLATAFKYAGAVTDIAAGKSKIPLLGTYIDDMLSAAEESMRHDRTGEAEASSGEVYYAGRESAAHLAQLAYLQNTPDSELANYPALQGHQSDPSTWGSEQWADFNDYIKQNGDSSRNFGATVEHAGQYYQTGFDSAENTIKGSS